MKKIQNGNIALVVSIVVIVALASVVVGWIFGKKMQVPVEPAVITKYVEKENTTEPVAKNDESDFSISHSSKKYLVITKCSGVNPCVDHLFDAETLTEIKLQFPMFGSVVFSDDEKYVATKGLGRVAQPGIAIEIIDGKKVYCLFSEEDVADEKIANGILSFTEFTLDSDVGIKKEIDIEQYCNKDGAMLSN